MNGWGWIKSMAEVLGAGTLTHLLGLFFVQGLGLGRRDVPSFIAMQAVTAK
jgi:hypothetical protein